MFENSGFKGLATKRKETNRYGKACPRGNGDNTIVGIKIVKGGELKDMRIKQLELKGFKSFKNRTVIRFGTGTNGIVGPNGCGKSNVIDAFLWVMGETAPGHLRGTSMEDLIFAGTGKHPPSGIAEVSLVMESPEGENILPLSLSSIPPAHKSVANRSCSEVMLTRRLDRDGKSEYFINSQPCRLKDIQELFMDTGAGVHGFSFIEQGAVESFISSKPEQKRLLIESAAGISKFRSRKKSAERKLELTEINLKRLKDILLQQSSRLEQLKKQSRKAEKFRNLKKQIREKDLQISKWDLNQIHIEKDLLDTQIHEENKNKTLQEKELAQMRIKADNLRKVYENKKTKVEKEEIEIQSVKNQFLFLEKERAALKASIQVYQQHLSSQSPPLYKQKRRTLLDQIKETGNLVFQLNKKQKDLDEKWQKVNKEYEEASEKVSEVNVKKQSLKTELINYTHQEVLSKEREQSVFEKITDLNQSKKEWTQTLQKKSKELEELQSQKKILNEELEYKKQLCFNLINSVQELKKDVDAFKKGVQTQESKLKKEQEEASVLYSEWNSLKKWESRINTQKKGIQCVLQSEKYKNFFIDTASEIRVLSPLLEKAISSYMTLRLQSVFCREKESVLSALSLLGQEEIGRCRFLLSQKKVSSSESVKLDLREKIKEESGIQSFVTDHIEGNKELVDLLFSDTVIVKDVETMFHLKEKYSDWCFLTPKGEVLTRDGDFIGGAFTQEEMNILSCHRAIKDLSVQYENKKKQINLTLGSLKKTKTLFQNSVDKLSTLSKEEGHFQIRLLEIEKDLESLTRDYDRLSSEVSHVQKKIMECEEKRQELQKQKDHLQNQNCLNTQKKFKLELENAEVEYEKMKQEKHILSRQKDQLWEELTSCEKDLFIFKEKQSLLKQSLENAEQAEKNASFFSLEKKKHIQDYEKKLEEKEQQWKTLHQRITDQEECTTALVKEQEEINKEITQAQSSIIHLQEALVKRESSINHLQLQMESLLLKKSALLERAMERYQVELESLIPEEQELSECESVSSQDLSFDRDKEEQTLQKLNKSLSSIGEVNLLALKEYEELVQENDFYQKQYTDLCAAKEKLSQVIKRIDRFCSKKFTEVFEQVSSVFSRIWPSLFDGGKAEMVLIKDKEKGTEGLDIMVQPPGKKVQNMNLLSGGEKAMTSVAVIFSIFLVKPSPFCILDEVDAPLDDVNIIRFNSLLVEMAKVSQVIIITHNKYTMKGCRYLYGVTMEEKGVSKIMSLNMQSHHKKGHDIERRVTR
ncbi:MAG: chromosome segregation protein SMC [Bdellovibrionales bacterium]|nr:chromosome segregation protein SMC [Bdellovibrionales bacterium]